MSRETMQLFRYGYQRKRDVGGAAVAAAPSSDRAVTGMSMTLAIICGPTASLPIGTEGPGVAGGAAVVVARLVHDTATQHSRRAPGAATGADLAARRLHAGSPQRSPRQGRSAAGHAAIRTVSPARQARGIPT